MVDKVIKIVLAVLLWLIIVLFLVGLITALYVVLSSDFSQVRAALCDGFFY